MTQNLNSPFRTGQDSAAEYDIFAICRVESTPAGRIVSGRLRPGLTPESPAVRAFVQRWPGYAGSRSSPLGWELILVEPAPRRERWWLHVALLLATLFSTIVAGSLLAGRAPILFTALPLWGRYWLPLPVQLDPGALVEGLPFGIALVCVLAVHEAGHYLVARWHRISVTPPFFIPFPPYVSIIGTLGAFIRLRSPVLSRRALLDVGVAGPLASFVASLPLLWWGLANSRLIMVPSSPPGPFAVQFGLEQFWLGGSLAASGLARLVVGAVEGSYVLALHPIAFAGWLGLFVTALNLLPISQLDGGHILYALLGDRQRPLAWLFFLTLIPLGLLWAGWWVWAVLVFVIGRGRIHHPPLYNHELRLDRGREALGLAGVVIFMLCFVPVPFLI